MISLKDTIEEDCKRAYRAGDTILVDILRLVKAQCTNAQIEKRAQEGDHGVSLSDDEVIVIIRKQAKGLEEALALYKQGGRGDLVDRTTDEIRILKKYLPQELGEAAIKEQVRALIATLGNPGKEAFGNVMGKAMKGLKGQVSGEVVSKVVHELLG